MNILLIRCIVIRIKNNVNKHFSWTMKRNVLQLIREIKYLFLELYSQHNVRTSLDHLKFGVFWKFKKFKLYFLCLHSG